MQLEGWRWTVEGDPVKQGMYLRVKFPVRIAKVGKEFPDSVVNAPNVNI